MSFDLNDFFESIKVIVDGRLNDLSYDTTIVATITDDSDKERGHYIVSDGTITFDAYVNDMNYKSGDQVRVSIMNGDWSKKKFIIGLYNENTDKGALTYIPPLGDVFSADFSNNNVINDFTLYSNGQETVRRIWGKQITPDSSEYALQANGVYNVITLSGAFQTQLGALSAGGYGLKLDVYSKTEVGSNERINRFMTFDSSEMIGNPYSFVIDSYQQKQIAIGFDGIIDEIVLSIYQGVSFDDKGNEVPNLFFDKDNIEIEELPINFKNLIVGFGSNLSSIEDNSLKFYTPDSTTYKYHNGNGDETNDKRFGLIWYNKNENNGYVGYSDGVYDPDYDEIQYLKFAHTDSRLTRNIGKTTIANDELSLTLAANIEESQPYMQDIYEALTTSLSSELQALGREISGWASLKTQLNQLIASYVPEGEEESVSAKLVQAREIAEDATQNWANLYAKILQHGYNLQNDTYTSVEKRNEALQEIEDWFNNADTGCAGKNPFTEFSTAISNVVTDVNALFITMEAETRVDSPMAGYRSIYNNYKARVDRVLKEIEVNMSKIITTSKIEWIKDEEDDDFNWFNYYKTHIATTDYPSYEKPESAFAEYANKYCMYLYRYVDVPTLVYKEDEEPDSENNIEYTFGRFLGPNWERVKISKDENGNDIPVLNPYLPGEGETIDTEVVDENGNKTIVSTTYHRASSEEEIFLNLRMEPTKDIEKYQIVFFHNHERILSNVLVFTNLEAEDIPPQFTVSANDIIKIEHGSYSQDHYQAYSQANDLVNIADESRRRMLQCTYDGVLSGNEALAGAEVFWYIPLNSTMLTYDRKYLVEDLGFFSDIDKDGNRQPTELSKDGYVYFSKTIGYDSEEIPSLDAEDNPIYDSLGNEIKETKITIHPKDRTFCYKIKSYYEHSAQNNTILVEAHIKDSQNRINIVKGELPLTFSSFGTNGTNYTLTIAPNTTQIASLPPTVPAEELLTEDEWNNLAEDNRLKTIYNSYNDYIAAEGANSLLVLKLGLRNGDGELLTLNEGFNVSVQNENVENEEITTRNLKIKWYASNGKADSVLTLMPTAEGSKERLIEVSRSYDANIPYVGIASATVEFQEELSDGTPRTLRLSTMYPIPYASSGSYYISGPTMIVYNNQGTVSRCSDEPFKLFQHTVDGDKEITDVNWTIEYYEDDGTHLAFDGEEYQNIIAYMPKLDYQKNTLLPAPMYTTFEEETAIIPVIVCKKGTNVVWSQPIIITQNNYASSTLNQWNGEFKVDEANGTILSTMVGAGIKTENNTFEGVLMGDIQRGANFDSNNASGIGIYGFNDGAQSFYLGVDGRAFFGKSGRGRIYFDGNQGTIASASYLQNRQKNAAESNDAAYAEYKVPIKDEDGNVVGYEVYNSSGMLIDLDDGFIDIKGTAYADETGSSYLDKHELYTQEEWESLPDDSQFKFTPIYTQREWSRLTNKEHNSYDDYIALVQPTPLTDYDSYVTAYDVDDIYIKSYKQSHIHIDAKSPYLIIHSGQQFNKNKHLMEISDSDYYLQTDDYKPTTFQTSDREAPFTEADGPGDGFKLDLKNSLLDAYNLKITSKNLFINSTGDGKPYFVIKSDYSETENESYRNLMYVDNETYYLQSVDFKPKDDEGYMGSGMKLTMRGTKPGIEAYNFTLRSGNTGAGDHRIILQDTSPYFIVNTNGGTEEEPVSKSLAVIGDNEFYFQSADYLPELKDESGTITQKGVGMRLSLSGKELKAYSGFTLKAYQPVLQDDGTYAQGTSYILVDATAVDYPFIVYGGGSLTYTDADGKEQSATKQFRVNWDGSLDAVGGTFKGAINATSGTLGTLKVTGTLNGGKIVGAGIYGSVIANDEDLTKATFHVTTAGHLTAASATIGGWSVQDTSGSGGYSGFSYPGVGSMTQDGLAFGDNFIVDADGNLFATSATFDTSLTVKAERGGSNVFTVNSTGDVDVQGNLSVKGTSVTLASDGAARIHLGDSTASENTIFMYGANICLYGDDVWIGSQGNLSDSIKVNGPMRTYAGMGIGADITEGYDLTVNGQSLMKGDFYYDGDIYTGSGSSAKKGVNGTVAVDGTKWFDSIYLTFENGILVSTDEPDDSTVTVSTMPDFTTADAGKNLMVNGSGTGLEWKKLYAPETKGTLKSVWSSSGDGDDATPAWRTMKELLDPPQSANAFLSNVIGGGGSQGMNVGLSWVTAYPPTTKGTTTQVWTGGGTSNPSWKTLNASLVNFSNTTVTPPTDGSGVYTVSIPYTKVSSSSETDYTSGHRVTVYANKELPAGYRIGGYEDKGSGWVSVGTVWASGEAYTKVTTSTSTSSVSGQVQISVSTS